MSRTMLAPEWRFKDLRAAQIATLPTRGRRNWYLAWAVGSAWVVVCAAYAAATERPLYAVVAGVFALSAAGHVREAREIGRQLRAPQAASYASFDEPGEWAQTGHDALGGAAGVVMSGAGGLVETAVGFAANAVERQWARTKPRQVVRWTAAIGADLLPGERRLVSTRAYVVPRGWRRAVFFLTIGLAGLWMVKRGFLTVTDQRLLYHRASWFRRPRRRLHLASPLVDVEVLEWYAGTYTASRYRVLILRGADGRAVRFDIHQLWAQEAQWVFDLLASCSARPPAFLAARWISPVE